jgi:outer membrane protein TolC
MARPRATGLVIDWSLINWLAALLLSLTAAVPARAQRVITLDEALAIARRNNRDLQQAKARVAQAQAGIETAWVPLLPNVAAQGKYTHNYKEVTLDETSFIGPTLGLADAIKASTSDKGLATAAFAFEQLTEQQLAQQGPIVIQKGEQLDFALNAAVPLLVPWAYPALSSAKKSVAAARATMSATEASVLLATAQAYYACAGTDELVGARNNALSVARQALDNAKARLEAGVVNRVEVTRAELQLVRADQALLETLDSQAQAYRALGTILNMHEAVRVQPADVAAPPATEPTIDELTSSALKLRPEFRALEQQISSLDSTVASNKWKWAPSLSGFAFVRAFNYAGFSGDKYAWAIGLQADWQLYDGGLRDAQRHLAWAQRQENEAKLDLLHDSVADDVFNAQRTLKTKRRAVQTAARSVQLSKETLELVTVQHEAGTATQLDLLQAQDALVAAEVALAQARFDLALGGLQLDRTAGTFPASHLK